MGRHTILQVALALALLAAPAGAQFVNGGFRIEGEPAERTAPVGEVARYLVVVRNDHALASEVALERVGPASNLTFAVDPPKLSVPAHGSDSFAVRLELPPDAAAGSRHPITFRARDPNLGASPTLQLVLVAEVPEETPAPPATTGIDVTAERDVVEASAGDGLVVPFTVRNVGSVSVHVLLDAEAPEGWSAALDVAALALEPGAVGTVQALATVPTEAAGSIAKLGLVARAGELLREAATTVHVAPAPGGPPDAVPETTPEPEPEEPSDPVEARPPVESARPRPAAPSAAPPETRAWSLLVSDRLVGPAAGVAVGTVTLLGGDEAVHVTLGSHVDAGWPADLQRRAVDVPAGGRVDLWIVVRIPADAVPGANSPGVVIAEAGDTRARAQSFTVEVAAHEVGATAEGEATELSPHVGGAGEVGTAGLVIRDVGRGFERAFEELSPILLASGTGLVAGLGLVAFAARREAWRIGAASLLAPLYTRLEKPGVLAHPDRARILARIASEPGLHFRGLQRALGLHTGALVYHLRVLERHRLLSSRRDGHLVRYFPITGPRVVVPALRGLRAEVMHAVTVTPGLTQREVAARIDASKQAVHYHVKALIAQGSLRMGVDGGLSPATTTESMPS